MENINDKTEIKNLDIIAFRHELIENIYSGAYNFGVCCNDGKTNIMTEERKIVLEDVLDMFNTHFMLRGYDIA